MEASPLNKLPAELRNRIYELAIHRRKDINLVANTKLRSLKATTRVPIALTVTCREIRKDTRSMFVIPFGRTQQRPGSDIQLT